MGVFGGIGRLQARNLGLAILEGLCKSILLYLQLGTLLLQGGHLLRCLLACRFSRRSPAASARRQLSDLGFLGFPHRPRLHMAGAPAR